LWREGLLGLLGQGGGEVEEEDAGNLPWGGHSAMIAWNVEDEELVLFYYK
jgi:hypothetical protein